MRRLLSCLITVVVVFAAAMPSVCAEGEPCCCFACADDSLLSSVFSIKSTSSSPDVMVFCPFDDDDSCAYADIGRAIAANTGGNADIFVGQCANAFALRRADDYGIVLIDGMGILLDGQVYMLISSAEGLIYDDYACGRAVDMGGATAICADFFSAYCTRFCNSLVYLSFDFSMSTDEFSRALTGGGCAEVVGYNGCFAWEWGLAFCAALFQTLCAGGELGGAYADAVSANGILDPLTGASAYIVGTDVYPSPFASDEYTVTSAWTLPVEALYASPTSIALSPSECRLFVGETAIFSACVEPLEAYGFSISWQSTDTATAIVDSFGVVTAVEVGQANVVCTASFTDSLGTVQTLCASASVSVCVPNGEYYRLVPFPTDGDRLAIVGTLAHFALNVEGETLSSLRAEICGDIFTSETPPAEWLFAFADNGFTIACGRLYLGVDALGALVYGDAPTIWNYDGTDLFTTDSSGVTRYICCQTAGEARFTTIETGGNQIRLYRVAGLIMGDMDGDGSVTSSDALTLLRITLGLVEPSDFQRRRTDINADGCASTADVLLALRLAMGA